MRVRPHLTAWVLAALALVPMALVAEDEGGVLAGRVEGSVEPLSAAKVYAYALSDLSLRREITDRDGLFLFAELPAGLYKVIAFKPGFLPAVVMLSRASTGATQFLDVQLAQQSNDPETAAASFWKLREKIPSDVLRDMDLPAYLAPEGRMPQAVPAAGPAGRTAPQGTPSAVAAAREIPADRFSTQMRASTGVHEGLDVGDGEINGAEVDFSGRVNDVEIALNGEFTELSTGSEALEDAGSGSTQELELRLAAARRATVNFSTRSNELSGARNDDSVEYERHAVSWTQAYGDRAQSNVSAQYTEENNFYRQALVAPSTVPGASRSWRIEGSYANQVTDRANVEAGVLYRERASDREASDSLLASETVELFGKGGWQINPALLVQYGLYSALRDGTLSVSPQGGLVFQIAPKWQAATLASRRLDTSNDAVRRIDFTPAYYQDARSCRQAEEYCYELSFSRSWTDGEGLKLGAVHRKIGETQRLFFDSDFFDRFDSLYLVDGDRLPELRLEVTRRLKPGIVARFESNLAAGGGGLLQTADNAYENDVRYLVTSFDTRFEGSATDLLVAFHRLEQELSPLGEYETPEMALERLQVGVSQDLGFLDRLASELAVHLNMELSRGGTSEELYEELRKRITGGLAVRF